MQLEFHQLDRRWEHLRARRPERQRRLLASLAASGQQTPIVVVAVADQPGRYLVIDGYQRIAALEQLGRDTVEAVVWPLREAEALVLDRSLRWGERETALEEGWLLAELEQHFGYDLEELARRFDRSVSWVSRRLALVELLPESVQQQVRRGAISAQVAMKYLVPVARSRPEDCQRLAEALAAHRFTSREAGQLYAAWRNASPSIRQRILEQPQLFLKAQRQGEADPPSSSVAELLRDLQMVVAITHRAHRRLMGATIEIDRGQCEQLRYILDRARHQLGRLAAQIPKQAPQQPEQEQADVEPKSTHRDSSTACARSEQTRDGTGAERLPFNGAEGPAVELGAGADCIASRESRTLPATDPGVMEHLQGESGPGPGGTGGSRGDPLLSSSDGLLPASRDRATARGSGGAIRLPPGPGTAA
jgi:ParB family chromosome partitioning protein